LSARASPRLPHAAPRRPRTDSSSMKARERP
jgi:hypothetical protein